MLKEKMFEKLNPPTQLFNGSSKKVAKLGLMARAEQKMLKDQQKEDEIMQS